MVQYSVILKRYEGSPRPDVVVFRDEDRERAISEMRKYVQKNGFSVDDRDGRFTIKTVVLEEKEPVAGAPVLSSIPYYKLFDPNGRRIAS